LSCPQPGSNPCPNCTIDIDPPAPPPPPPLTEIALVANTSLRSYQAENPIETGSTSRALIEIPSGWTAGNLQEATLELFRFDSTGRKEILGVHPIDTPPLLQGNTLEVTFPTPAEPFQAAVRFVMPPPTGAPSGATPLSVVSPLFVNSPE
jgi:hypothetical protein